VWLTSYTDAADTRRLSSSRCECRDVESVMGELPAPPPREGDAPAGVRHRRRITIQVFDSPSWPAGDAGDPGADAERGGGIGGGRRWGVTALTRARFVTSTDRGGRYAACSTPVGGVLNRPIPKWMHGDRSFFVSGSGPAVFLLMSVPWWTRRRGGAETAGGTD